MQSVTSTLSLFQRTKRILIGCFALLLMDWMSVSRDLEQRGMVSKAIVKMCRCYHHAFIITLLTEAYT